jgi:signal recognition particle GTPase
MFESLSQRLSATVNRLRGRGRLTEENIREALREVRIALLEADVALPVVQALIQRIKVRAVGSGSAEVADPGPSPDQGRPRRIDHADGRGGAIPEPQPVPAPAMC